MPVCTLSAVFPAGFSARVPFDAVSVPGSRVLQFLAREGSKPGRRGNSHAGGEEEVWTAVSTSRFARERASALRGPGEAGGEEGSASAGGAEAEAESEVVQEMARELDALMAPYFKEQAGAEGGGGGGGVPAPLGLSAKHWSAGFTCRSLGLKEDSVALAPWRLAIGGDFVRQLGAHATPFEAAALSGLEAGERAAAFFAAPQQ
jgi:hypothetical protein